MGPDFNFWESNIRTKWDPDYKPDLWGEFIRRAQKYVDTGRLDSEEIEYKVEIGQKVTEARRATLASEEDWADRVKSALPSGNIVHHIQRSKFCDWLGENADKARPGLQAFWTLDDSSLTDRIHAFNDLLPTSVISGTGTRMNVASVLLMGLDVEQYPPFQVSVFENAYKLTGYGQTVRDADEASLYEHALEFLDRFMDEGKKQGLKLRHRLDAQSVAWALWKGRDGPIVYCEDSPPWSPENIGKLAGELMWETKELQSIIDGLEDKGQVIFQGPPGTGKTFVAKRIGELAKKHGGTTGLCSSTRRILMRTSWRGIVPRS